MTIALCGSSREPKRIRDMAARIDVVGIPLNHRWWDRGDFGSPEEWGGKDALIGLDLQRHIARTNMRAIKAAEVVFVLWPEHDGRSTCEAEMAYALATGKRVVVTGSRASDCTWTALASYRDASDLLGLTEIARWYVEAGAIGLRVSR